MISITFGHTISMIKGRDLKKSPVIHISNGQLLGYVKEFNMSREHTLAGIYIVDHKQEITYISADKIVKIGRDAVLLNDIPEEGIDNSSMLQCEYNMNGSLVTTINGENIGVVQDVVFEDSGGCVIGYEISDGYLKDIIMGRKILDTSEILSYGDDAVIVSDSSPD